MPPSTDRATALSDILARLYPDDDALGYLHQQIPYLYDRLISGRDDARSFNQLGELFPYFGDELRRYYGGQEAQPIFGGLRGVTTDAAGAGNTFSDFGGPGFGTQAEATGFDPGAGGAFLGVLGSGLGNLFAPVADLGQSLLGAEGVQSFLSGAFPLTNAEGQTVYSSAPLGGEPLGALTSGLLGMVPGLGGFARGLWGAPTTFQTEAQIAASDVGGLAGPSGLLSSAQFGGVDPFGGFDAASASAAGGSGGVSANFGAGPGAGEGGGGGFKPAGPSIFRMPQFFGSDTDYMLHSAALTDPEFLSWRTAGGTWPGDWAGYGDWLQRWRHGGNTMLNRFGVISGTAGGPGEAGGGGSAGTGSSGTGTF